MANFIDTTYFTDIINIGGIATGNSPVVGSAISTTWIPKYEKEYLIKVLGYEFYAEFIAGLAVLPTPAQKWLDLRDGVDYEVNDRTFRWNGFKNTDKVSPVAFYCYAEYMTSVATISTGTGEKINKQQNSDNASPAYKIGYAWDAMRELNRSLWHYLYNKADEYSNYNRSYVDYRALQGSRNMFGI